MIAISKQHLGSFPRDTQQVEQDIADIGISLSMSAFILCYDTADEVVYHTIGEIATAMRRIPNLMYVKFDEVYAEDTDIHACIESGIVDTIVLETMKELCPHSMAKKYFLTLQDTVEALLTENFNSRKVVHNECKNCGFDMGESYENCGASADGVCPECGTDDEQQV